MRTKPLPTPEDLRKLLRYDPDTGLLFWRERVPEDFTDGKRSKENVCINWNTRFSGKESFTAISDGYKIGCIKGKMLRAHRVVWAVYYGSWPDGFIDHINGYKSDNRIKNLRDVTRVENARNCKLFSSNRTGHTGVHWIGSANKWRARSKINGKCIHIGMFDCKEDAIEARLKFNFSHGFTERHGVE